MSRTLTYIEAIAEGMWEEMERDPAVFLLGEDIGVSGGAFKATKGFLEKFGQERVLDTPLSEAAIIGAATGAALAGMRPVAEMQFADFVTCGFNQLVVNTSRIHYRWGIPVPLVVRLPAGGYIHGGPYHSACPEGWFFHVPGLRIVAPSTPADAKGLMKTAIRDDNPVLFVEYKHLYRRAKGEIPGGEHLVEMGSGVVRREGSDIGIISYGSTVPMCLEAAERLAHEEGVECTVADLRSLQPLDRDLILRVAADTGRVLVVHEDNLTGGIGAEIAALVADGAWASLDAPVKRLGALDTPVPFAPTLEEHCLPDAEKIHAALQSLARI
ncbi:MAG: alpha-ketoacid dehydrogenase subunit beta [Bacteroidota bacterium]